MSPEMKKTAKLYGRRATALSTAAQSLHGIWFPSGEKLGRVGRALKRLSQVMSSYRTVSELTSSLKKTVEPEMPPYLHLANVNDARAKEITCSQIRGGLDYVPYGTSGGYGMFEVNPSLTLYFVVDFPGFLERLDVRKVDVYASDIQAFVDWISSLLWEGVEHGLRATGSNWFMENELIPNPPSALLYDDAFVELLRKTSLRIRKYLEGGLPRRILLYGPPGTGKTTLAHTMALEAVGNRVLEVPLGVRFNTKTARAMNFRALVVNDVDRREDSEARTLMSYLEELQTPTLVVCSINVMKKLDPAIVRSGRFDEVIFVGYPRKEGLTALLNQLAEQYGVEVPADEVEDIPPAGLRELFHSLSIVGMEEKDAEIARLRFQARLSGDKRTSQFLLGGPQLDDDTSESDESRYDASMADSEAGEIARIKRAVLEDSEEVMEDELEKGYEDPDEKEQLLKAMMEDEANEDVFNAIERARGLRKLAAAAKRHYGKVTTPD